MPDPDRGLYAKYTVERTDGDPKSKHDECRYFVLDPQHDPYARVALEAYAAEATNWGYTALGHDLHDWLDDLPTIENLSKDDE